MTPVLQKFDEVTNLKQLNELIQAYFAGFGIKSLAVTVYQKHVKTGNQLRYHWVSKELKPWHLHYLEQGYADVDRTLEYTVHAHLPVWWSVSEQLVQAKNIRERRIREESLEYGLDKGLSIPMQGIDDDFITLTLHQRKGEYCLERVEDKLLEWLGILHYYYQYLRIHLPAKAVGSGPLTRREEQCLQLTAQGVRLEKIAEQLAITPRTVNFHLQNANKKLGTNNKYHSIIRMREQDYEQYSCRSDRAAFK